MAKVKTQFPAFDPSCSYVDEPRDDGFTYRVYRYHNGTVRNEVLIGRTPRSHSSPVPRGTQLELFPDAQTKF